LASFRWVRNLVGYRPHIGRRVVIQLDLLVGALVLPAGRSIPFEVTIGTILARIDYA
jgi:hypothetical protein